MTILFDVFRELFRMFVADLRLTLAIPAGVALVALLLDTGAVAAMTAGGLLTGLCIAVLLGSDIREAVRRRK